MNRPVEPGIVSDAEGLTGVAVDIIALARREDLIQTAGNVAYFTLLSLVPLLLLLAVTLSALGGEALATRAVNRAARTLTAENAALIQGIVFGAASRREATIVGTAVLLWGGLLTFRALKTAFADVYDTDSSRSLLGAGTDVVVVFVLITVAVMGMIAGGAVLSVLVRTSLWDSLGPLVLFAVLLVVFLPLYYVLPDIDAGLWDVLPGTVFAALAWTVLQALFGYYTTISGISRIYGAASAFLLVLVWLYAGGFVLLVGAALNAVLAGEADPDAEWTLIE
jgi:membrane protein